MSFFLHVFLRRGSFVLVTCVAMALAGCAVGPDFRKPDAPKATGYSPTPIVDAGQGDDAQRFVTSMDVAGDWWKSFDNAALDSLVDDALAHNPSVDAAHASLQAAWENVYAQRGANGPSVGSSITPTRQKTARDLASSAQSGASLYSLTTAQVTVSYAPDLWGGKRRQVESLVAQAQAQRFQLEATYLTLTSNVVNAAIGEASLRGQLDTTRHIVEMQARMLDTLRRQQALGDVSEAAVALQVAVLEQSRATLPPLEKQLAQQRDLLAALTGRSPDARLDARFDLDGLVLPTALPLSVPSRLVEQRPDVRAAEEAWHAANATVGVAVANRLPQFQLNGSFGRTSESASSLFGSGAGFWSLAGGVTQPLFDGGALKHQQRAAEASARQASAQYRGTVIAALQGVADVLQAVESDGAALTAAQGAADAATRSLAIARRQLALGDLGESGMLLAEVASRQADIAVVQAKAARLSDTVALFQALGGGWWNRPEPTVGSR